MTDSNLYTTKMEEMYTKELIYELGVFHMIYSDLRLCLENFIFKLLTLTSTGGYINYIRWVINKLPMREQLALLKILTKDMREYINQHSQDSIDGDSLTKWDSLVKQMENFTDKRNQYSHRFFIQNDEGQFDMLYMSGKHGVSSKREPITIGDLKQVNREMSEVYFLLKALVERIPASPMSPKH